MSKSVISIQKNETYSMSRRATSPAMVTCSLILLTISLITLPERTSAADKPESCSKVEIEEKKDGTARVYAIDATTSFVTDYDAALDKPGGDYGRRLMLFRKEDGADKRVYYSEGSYDSYILEPAFYSNCGGYDLLILAEIDTEYSWGLRLFSYKDGEMNDLGSIPIAVDTEEDIYADSIVPHLILREKGSALVISFGKDVARNPGGLDEKHYAADAIEYRITGGRLEERIRDDIQE